MRLLLTEADRTLSIGHVTPAQAAALAIGLPREVRIAIEPDVEVRTVRGTCTVQEPQPCEWGCNGPCTDPYHQDEFRDARLGYLAAEYPEASDRDLIDRLNDEHRAFLRGRDYPAALEAKPSGYFGLAVALARQTWRGEENGARHQQDRE